MREDELRVFYTRSEQHFGLAASHATVNLN